MDTKTIELSGRKYVLHKIPAFQAQKILFHCLRALKSKDMSAIPDDILLQLCSYIGAINGNDVEIKLSDRDMIDINVSDAGVLMMLELNILEYNFGFFFDGSLLKEVNEIFKRLNPTATKAEGMTDTSKV